MKKNIFRNVLMIASLFIISCQKSVPEQEAFEQTLAAANSSNLRNPEITPYKFERINAVNFYSQGWREQQLNIISGNSIFSDASDYVEVVCGPDNTSDRRLIRGSVTMNLPTSADPTLRRVRLRKGGYSGTLLADLTELKYSTYVVQNAATVMVLQVDINNDEAKDFNIYFEPRLQHAPFTPLQFNRWQQWNALQGKWHIEAGFLPEFPNNEVTIQQLIALPQYANARIIDTPPMGHNGEGVRFTIGGNPRSAYNNTIGYFDALIVGTKDQQHSTLYDFTCNNSNP